MKSGYKNVMTQTDKTVHKESATRHWSGIGNDNISEECRTYNRRFGTMAGVTPQKVSWEIER